MATVTRVWVVLQVVGATTSHISGVFSTEKKARKFIDRWYTEDRKIAKPISQVYFVDYRAKDKPVKYATRTDAGS